MGISDLMKFQKSLVNGLFQFQLGLNCVQSRIPFLSNGFLNILENNTSSAHVLIRNQFLSVFTFLGGVVGKTLGKSFESDIITIKITSHSHVDIASIELHVDLLVNHSLGVGVKVDPDTGSHFNFLDNLKVFLKISSNEKVKSMSAKVAKGFNDVIKTVDDVG